MTAVEWIRVLSVFLFVAAAVVLLAWVWEYLRERARRRQVLGTVQRWVRPAGAEPDAAAPLLRRSETGARWGARIVERVPRLEALSRLLEQAAVSWGVSGFLVRAAGIGLVLALLLGPLFGAWGLVPVALALGAALPYLYLRRARARRISRVEEQFPDAVDLLARAIRAGHPFSAGLKMVADESPEPLAGEFRRVFEEQRFGLPLHESLSAFADRLDLLDVRMFVTAVLIQREVGGNLAEILDRISFTVRERFKILRQVQVYTAQGRLTGILLSLLPVGLGVLLAMMNPGYMSVLWTEPAGRAMLGTAVTLQGIGYFLIRRITTIEV